jgi:hypothetical protein
MKSQGSTAPSPKTLQSQVRPSDRKRILLNGLEIVHGRLLIELDTSFTHSSRLKVTGGKQPDTCYHMTAAGLFCSKLRSATLLILEPCSAKTGQSKQSPPDSRQTYIMLGRYTHAHQFERVRRELKFLRTRLGRIIRDIRRQIDGDPALEDRFGPLLDLALRVRHQEQRQSTRCTPRGGVYRQRQGPGTLRVRLQGLDHHPGHRAQRRAVRAARQGAAWQPV